MKLPDRKPIYSSSGEERRYYNSSYELDFFPEDQDGDFLSQLHSDKGNFEFFINLPRVSRNLCKCVKQNLRELLLLESSLKKTPEISWSNKRE